ncbi:MAG: hypothetical protein GY938_03265 [Ketobacter sp.]|nr:hypothetical protein [Ketobacter sp.]
MKVSFLTISDVAYRMLDDALNGDDCLGRLHPEMAEVERAELALFIKRCLVNRRKRIVIDVDWKGVEG